MAAEAVPLHETTISYIGADRQMHGWFARPEGSHRVPGVVLLHDVYGLTDHVRDVARRLASAGYAVLAPDLYTRGDGPTSWPPKREEVSRMARYPDLRTIADVQGAVAALQERPDIGSDRIALLGFSFGARYSLFAAGAGAQVAAVVAFYPIIIYPELNASRPRQPLSLVPNIACPLLVVYGDQDALLPRSHVTFFRALLQGLGKPHDFYVYPSADHGFLNTTIKNYNAAAAEEAWAKTLMFLKRHV